MAEAPTVSDEEVVTRLRQLLQEVDLETTTERQLRKKLEAELGVDLSGRKAIVKAEVERYLTEKDNEEGGDEADDAEEEEEEEEEAEEEAGAKRKRGGGFSKPLMLSEPLAAFLGVDAMPRTEVVKQLWVYIKAHGLQDPSDKRKIRLDDKLRTFLTEPCNMLSMNKQLSKHIFSGEPAGPARPPAAKKPRKSSGGGGGGGGFTKQYRVTPRLQEWIGSETISRPEFTKFFWSYVKDNGLQDPSNKSVIQCDDKLRELTGEDTIKGFGFQKYFSDDFLKDE